MNINKEIIDIEERLKKVVRAVTKEEYVSANTDSFLADVEGKVKQLRALVDAKKV